MILPSARRATTATLEPVHAPRVLALCGGVGGAKLALGLARAMPAEDLALWVNTGDDFEHLGLSISPDLDTVLYTLAGLSDPERGWGRADESFRFLEALTSLGGDTWFSLGDQDLALHVQRTAALRSGASLSQFTASVARQLGVASRIWPMSDDAVRTQLATDEGELEFQHYFVRRRCEPRVKSIRFEGAERAQPLPAALAALRSQRLEAVIVCPSNPYLSIDPILALPGVRETLARCRAPVIAISPLVGGRAVKGPTAKIMGEIGARTDSATIAAHYRGLIDGLVIDTADADAAMSLDLAWHAAPTLMRSLDDRVALAGAALGFARTLTPVALRRAS
jgi:LPPG:FO 2-phospho-L-lactate transferase